MTAQDKLSGKSEQITITSDKGRLSQDEIDRMVKEAEEYAESDRTTKEQVEARNQLESYLYSLRNTVKETLKDKISEANRETISTAVTETLAWLEANPNASKEELDDKKQEVEGVAGKIIAEAYRSSTSTPSSESSSDGDGDSNDGPSVEEMD